MKLYREVRIETADDLDQLEEYYVKEASPDGAWQIVLVPIESEEETVERPRLCQPVPDVFHRFTTPWTLYTPKEAR